MAQHASRVLAGDDGGLQSVFVQGQPQQRRSCDAVTIQPCLHVDPHPAAGLRACRHRQRCRRDLATTFGQQLRHRRTAPVHRCIAPDDHLRGDQRLATQALQPVLLALAVRGGRVAIHPAHRVPVVHMEGEPADPRLAACGSRQPCIGGRALVAAFGGVQLHQRAQCLAAARLAGGRGRVAPSGQQQRSGQWRRQRTGPCPRRPSHRAPPTGSGDRR